MHMFTSQVLLVRIGEAYLWAICLAEPFMALAIASGGGLRGAGDTRPALNYTLVAQWLVRLPASYLLAFSLGLDTDGLWIGLVIVSALQGALTVRRYAGGAWKAIKV